MADLVYPLTHVQSTMVVVITLVPSLVVLGSAAVGLDIS